jgi:hypothetical protein
MKWQRRQAADCASRLRLATATASGAVDLYGFDGEHSVALERQSRLHVAQDQLALSLDWNDGVSLRCGRGRISRAEDAQFTD